VHVEGQLVFNGTFQMLNAALAGFGLAYVPEDVAQPHLTKGRLKRVLEDWCPAYSGYHLYYPSRRQPTPAFALLVEALRYREPGDVTTPRNCHSLVVLSQATTRARSNQVGSR
jgi:DNA-binding transcriptional LysR family regulator